MRLQLPEQELLVPVCRVRPSARSDGGKAEARSLAPHLSTHVTIQSLAHDRGKRSLLPACNGMKVALEPFVQKHGRPFHMMYAIIYSRSGKGRHAAGLNFGDFLSYAVARLAGQPLLCAGSDFAKPTLRSPDPGVR